MPTCIPVPVVNDFMPSYPDPIILNSSPYSLFLVHYTAVFTVISGVTTVHYTLHD
jgi:hypothetical protein